MLNNKNEKTEAINVDVKVGKPEEDPKEEILKQAVKEVAKVDSTKEVSVIVGSLNVRKNANINSEILGIVRSGDILTVSTTRVGEWWKVEQPMAGYVMSEFVADVKR